MMGEQLFALVDLGLHEALARIGQTNVALLDFGEAQQLQRFDDREQIVDLHL